MHTLTKNLLAGAVVAGLALTGAVMAEENVKHKLIEIIAAKDHDVKVMVGTDGAEGGAQKVMISHDELTDSALLESKLANLDEDTRKTVMDALKGISMSEHGDGEIKIETKKMVVMNKGEGQRLKFLGVGDGTEKHEVHIEVVGDGKHQMVRKHFIHGVAEHGVLTGHTDAIAKLIERGEFSQEELDKIQAAVDAKR